MKILLVNKYFYRKGGAETYFFRTRRRPEIIRPRSGLLLHAALEQRAKLLEQVFRI